MRALAALVSSLAALPSAPAPASADPMVLVTWTGTTGFGVPGSSTISAHVGDTLTLTVTLVGDETQSVTGFGPGFIWDSGGSSVLDLLSEDETLMPGMDIDLNNGPVVQSGAPEAQGGGYAQAAFSQFALVDPGVAPGATASPGSLIFVATGIGITVVRPGFIDPAHEAIFGSGTAGSSFANITWGDAVVDSFFIPEPGSGILMALGLGLLAAAGRRRWV